MCTQLVSKNKTIDCFGEARPLRTSCLTKFFETVTLAVLWKTWLRTCSCGRCGCVAIKVFAQDKVHLHHPHLQLVFMKTQMGLVKGFFARFPVLKKVRRSPGTRVRECFGVPAHPS